MFDALPQLIIGLLILIPTLIFCQILIVTWRWVGRRFIFNPSLEPSNLSQTIWMKTAPLVIYFIILPIPMIAVLGIWDIKSVSQPATHLIGIMISSPLIWVGSLLMIAAIHIMLLKLLNREGAS